MTLATQNNRAGLPATTEPTATLTGPMGIGDVWKMAESLSDARMLPGCETPQQAFVLMLLCQSEGLHPIQAMRRYHVIEGRPAMRADAMQAEFQARGGNVKMIRNDEVEARAHLSHPTLQPDGFEFSFTYEQAVRTGLNVGKYGEKVNWKVSRADMLWSRMITKAIRKIYPGIVAGIYSDAEVEDMAVLMQPAVLHAQSKQDAIEAVVKADIPVPGQPVGVPDIRPYSAVATDAAKVVGYESTDMHRHLMLRALTTGHAEGTNPRSIGEAIKKMTPVYAEHRDWVRQEIVDFCQLRLEVTPAAVVAVEATVGADEADPDPDFDEPGSNG